MEAYPGATASVRADRDHVQRPGPRGRQCAGRVGDLKERGAEMAQHRVRSDGEDGRHFTDERRGDRPDPIDAAMEGLQPPGPDAALDRGRGQPTRRELSPCDDAVLSLGERGEAVFTLPPLGQPLPIGRDSRLRFVLPLGFHRIESTRLKGPQVRCGEASAARMERVSGLRDPRNASHVGVDRRRISPRASNQRHVRSISPGCSPDPVPPGPGARRTRCCPDPLLPDAGAQAAPRPPATASPTIAPAPSQVHGNTGRPAAPPPRRPAAPPAAAPPRCQRTIRGTGRVVSGGSGPVPSRTVTAGSPSRLNVRIR